MLHPSRHITQSKPKFEMSSQLSKFLKSPQHSQARELLLTSKIKYDMLLAAAIRGYDLLIYKPTVDCDGFDLIFDDRITLVPIQLKSVAGKTNSWSIHRKLIRPLFSNLEGFELQSLSYGTGRSGGILLVAIKEEHQSESLEITYYYSDILIIHLFLENLIRPKNVSQYKIDTLYYKIFDQIDGMFNLPKWAFVKAKSPEHLLALAGLSSRESSQWRQFMYELLCYKNIPNFQSACGSEYEIRKYIQEQVVKLIAS